MRLRTDTVRYAYYADVIAYYSSKDGTELCLPGFVYWGKVLSPEGPELRPEEVFAWRYIKRKEKPRCRLGSRFQAIFGRRDKRQERRDSRKPFF